MKQGRFNEEQIVAILKEAEAGRQADRTVPLPWHIRRRAAYPTPAKSQLSSRNQKGRSLAITQEFLGSVANN